MKVISFIVRTKFGFLLLLTGFIHYNILAQTTGDYRTRTAIMNWNTAANWERFDGTAWQIASQKPQSVNTVFIQNGHTVTLTGNESCKDLHLSTGLTTASNGTDAVLALQENTLEVYGKIRAYFAPLGTVPGSSTASLSGDPITKTPGSSGKISFVGNTRIITNTGEWSAVSTAYPTTFAIEINMNPGQTAFINTVVKASGWRINSGILDAGLNRLSVDTGTDGQGDFYVAPEAVFKSARTGAGSNAILSRGATTSGGEMIVDGTLIVSGLSPTIGMKAIQFNGTVEFDRAGNQNFVAGFTDGAMPLIYKNVKLSGSGTKTTLADATTVLAENGTLEIAGTASVATFAMGANGGLSVYSTGTRLIYNGPALQTTGVEWLTDFSEIVIDNPAGVTLNTARIVTNKLTLQRGTVNSTATRSFTIGENGQIAGGSESSFINGPLTWVVNTTASKEILFPIGKGTVYKPVALKVTQSANTATNYTAEMFNTAPTTRSLTNSELDNISSIRYYKLTKGSGGASISQASLKIFYGPDDAVTDPANLRIARSSASSWLNVGGAGEPMVNGAGTITSDVNFTTLGDFVLANARNGTNPLPVTLVSFGAVKKQSGVVLEWQTSCEINSDRFEIERSLDNVAFEKIGSVKSAGTTSSMQHYIFEDHRPKEGTNYYRLKQVDLDGSFVYSKIVTVKTTLHKTAVTVYPNPASDNIYIQAPGISDMRLEISNAAGQVVLSKKITGNVWQPNQPISITHLPAGVYQLILSDNAGRQSVKLIKE